MTAISPISARPSIAMRCRGRSPCAKPSRRQKRRSRRARIASTRLRRIRRGISAWRSRRSWPPWAARPGMLVSSLFGFTIRGFDRGARPRRAFIDIHDFVLAHLDHVAVIEVVAPYALGLHVDSIGAVQVLDEAGGGLRHDLTVVPADELAVDLQIVVRCSTDD